jgi:hypothetical protein
MKKGIILLLFTIGFADIMFAQEGMQSIGVNIPMYYRKNNFSTGIGVNYQYNFSNYFRGEFVGSYSPIYASTYYINELNNGDDLICRSCFVVFQAFINAHFFLLTPRVIRPYIIFGGGIQGYYSDRCEADHDSDRIFVDKYFTDRVPALNLGLGIDARLSYKWTLQASVLVLKPFTKGLISDAVNRFEFGAMARVGINYNF